MTTTLPIPAILAKMGIRPVCLTDRWEDLAKAVGHPPDGNVFATLIGGGLVYALRSAWERPSTQLGALHEALHLVMGKPSFEDEQKSGLMAVEWAIAQHLQPEMYRVWRSVFSEYGLTWTSEEGQEYEVGSDDAFLESPEWGGMVQRAINQGFLDQDGNVLWGLGVHPSCRSV